MPIQDLQQDEMMVHLMEALENKQDIGHYGRLVFAMTARHFFSDEEVFDWLKKDPDCDDAKARSILVQVEQRGYNPPRRDRVLDWINSKAFPFVPTRRTRTRATCTRVSSSGRSLRTHSGIPGAEGGSPELRSFAR